MGVSPTLLTHVFIIDMTLVLISLLYSVDVSYFGHTEPPPQLVNQTGGFHSADGTDPQGGVSSALDIHFTVPLPFGLSICCIPFMGGAFPSCHLWASASGPPPFLVISFDAFQGGAFLFMTTICWDVKDLINKKEKKRYILELLALGLVSH